jgi:hypothetical protein
MEKWPADWIRFADDVCQKEGRVVEKHEWREDGNSSHYWSTFSISSPVDWNR